VTTVADVKWALTGQSCVTVLGGDAYLIERVTYRATCRPPYMTTAFVLSVKDGDVLINGQAIDLGDEAMAFLSLIDEADAVGVPGIAYLSDPDAN
jgi:hypothetical protein